MYERTGLKEQRHNTRIFYSITEKQGRSLDFSLGGTKAERQRREKRRRGVRIGEGSSPTDYSVWGSVVSSPGGPPHFWRM